MINPNAMIRAVVVRRQINKAREKENGRSDATATPLSSL